MAENILCDDCGWPGKTIALLNDKWKARGTENLCSASKNVEVILLPLNISAKLQPLQADITAAVKSCYRKVQCQREIHLIDDKGV